MFQRPTLYPSSLLLSTVGSESTEAFLRVVQLMLESFRLTGGRCLVHLSAQGPTKDTSVWAVAGPGRRGVSLLTGSVNKLIDFISSSHRTVKPHCPYSIYMPVVERITFPNFYAFFFALVSLSPHNERRQQPVCFCLSAHQLLPCDSSICLWLRRAAGWQERPLLGT